MRNNSKWKDRRWLKIGAIIISYMTSVVFLYAEGKVVGAVTWFLVMVAIVVFPILSLREL